MGPFIEKFLGNIKENSLFKQMINKNNIYHEWIEIFFSLFFDKKNKITGNITL